MTRALALVALLLVPFSAHARTEAPVAPLEFGAVPSNFSPAMATDGVQSFVVWNDSRDRAANAIYGARLDADGTLLDPIGVRLFDGIGEPAIAYGDGRYFVIDPSLRFAVVDREANVVGRGALGAPGAAVRVVFNGSDFVAFWGYDAVNVSIVDRDGQVSEPAPLVPQHFELRLHAAATNGSRIVALYTRGVELRAAVTTMTGAPVSDIAIASSIFAEVPASISDEFVAVWQRLEGGVAAVRLDADGALVQGPVVVVEEARAPQLDGSQLYTYEGEIFSPRLVRRELADDLAVGPAVTLFESRVLSVAAFAVLNDRVVAHLRDASRRVAEEGLYAILPGQIQLVSRAGVTQLEPRVATGASGTLVAWREESALMATFRPRAGRPGHFTIASGHIISHAVAAQGDTHLVAWASNDGIFARIDDQTVALEPYGFTDVAAASDGHGFVVAWAKAGDIHIARVATNGEVTDRIAVRYGTVTGPPPFALACDGGECLVVWRNQTSRWTCPRFGCLVVDEKVLAVRLDASLAALDAEPRVLSEDVTGTISRIAAAADDGEYAVSWEIPARTYVRTFASDETIVVQGRRPSLAREDRGWLLVRENGGELVAMRIRDAGAPYEFPLLPRDAQVRTAPAVARDGASVVAVYERTTRGEAAGGVPRVFLTAIGPAKGKARAISR